MPIASTWCQWQRMRERSWRHTVEVLRPASWLNALSLVILWQLLVECQNVEAITAGGGVTTRIKTRCMLRAPVTWQSLRYRCHWRFGWIEQWILQPPWPTVGHAQVFIFDNIADANQFYRFAHKATTQDIPTRNCVKIARRCRKYYPHWLCGNCAVGFVRTLKFFVTRDLSWSWPSLLPQNKSHQAAIKDTLHKNIGHLTEERTRLRPVLLAAHFFLQAEVCRLSWELLFALGVPFVAEG